jgi:hypothetical protein
MPPRHLLPRDLPGALARLDDGEIDNLLATVTDEARRRGRLPPATTVAAKPSEADRRAVKAPLVATRAKFGSRPSHALTGEGDFSLALGKANAVRAAFAAGVKPSTIARQFGISQSAVKQALAAEARERKSWYRT